MWGTYRSWWCVHGLLGHLARRVWYVSVGRYRCYSAFPLSDVRHRHQTLLPWALCSHPASHGQREGRRCPPGWPARGKAEDEGLTCEQGPSSDVRTVVLTAADIRVDWSSWALEEVPVTPGGSLSGALLLRPGRPRHVRLSVGARSAPPGAVLSPRPSTSEPGL